METDWCNYHLGIFAVALGVALLPTLSNQAAKGKLKDLVQTLGFSIRLILFVTIPATVGLIVLKRSHHQHVVGTG